MVVVHERSKSAEVIHLTNMANTSWVIVIFGESHTALAEIDPNPDSEAVIIRIQVISVILKEVIGRNSVEQMRLNREVVADEPL